MSESFAPQVRINGIDYTPEGWMWILGFAIGGCEWAIEECKKPEFDKKVKIWLKEQKAWRLQQAKAGYEDIISRINADLVKLSDIISKEKEDLTHGKKN